MSIFKDYAAKMRQTQTPFTGRLQQYTRDRWNPRQQSPLFNTERALAISPQAGQGVATTVDTTPQIDTGNAIASLAELMGPTPAEREAQQRRLQENKAKMAAWTGLFDGLRQIGNVIYTAKGATPQRFADPYQQIEQQYQGQRQLANEQNAYQRQYAQALYNLQRQANADKRQNMLAEAQARWYGTRDAGARQKAESDAAKAQAQVNATNARAEQIRARTKQLEELHPLQKQKLQSVIKKYLHDAGRPYSTRGGGRSSSNDPYEELATHLQDNPDVVGPILQNEGLGFYDNQSKEFTFTKNVTKGMATTGNKRTRQQLRGMSGRRGSTTPRSGATNNSGFFNK